MRSPSWVVVEKSTSKVVIETFSKTLVEQLNTEKYLAVPIMEYLQNVNMKLNNTSRMK